MTPGLGLWEQTRARAAATPDALFAVDERDRRLSFAEYRDACERCAAGLAALSVGTGTRVSWMLPTWLEALVLAGSLARLGAVQNPILPIYREREVAFITRQSRAELLVVPGSWRSFDYPTMARAVAAEHPGLEVLVVDRELPAGEASSLPPPPPAPDAETAPVRWIFFSSGTTADPKGAKHTDATLAAASAGMSDALRLRPDDRVALVFPVTHVGGILWLMNGLRTGCGHIAIASFDPKASVDVLARHGVTQAGAGTAFHQAYLAAQRERGGDPIFPRVRCFPGGGAPKPPQLHYDLKREIGGAGVVSGYGMTECPVFAMNEPDDADEKLARTEGRRCPAEAEIRVVGATGAVLGAGEEGEFRVRAPQLCKGYLDPALDAEAFDEEGYFRTGDLGYLDADGYAVVTGRLKDVIIRKGENISAKEVEDLLYRHPKVRDVGVIGLPDPNTGERACAVVACAKPTDPLRFEEMTAFLAAQKLAVQKIPEQLELVDELPRNPTGKVLKHELRKRFAGA